MEDKKKLEEMHRLSIYACCMKKSHWNLQLWVETENHHHNSINMSLYNFSKILYASNRYEVKDLFKKDATNEQIYIYIYIYIFSLLTFLPKKIVRSMHNFVSMDSLNFFCT